MSRDRAVELAEELTGLLGSVDFHTAQAALKIARIVLLHKQDLGLVESANNLAELSINVP